MLDERLFQPKVVSDSEDQEFSKHLERLEEANREISGDDDDSDEDSNEEDKDGNDQILE